MRPSECLDCRDRFGGDMFLQSELRHLAVRDGESAAVEELNERYGEWHSDGHPDGFLVN